MFRIARRQLTWLWIVAFSVAAAVVQVGAQQGGTVSGTIRDEQQGVIVGAAVALHGTGADRTAHTDAHGAYEFADVEAGSYRLTIEASGFVTRETGPIMVTTGHSLTRDVELEVAGGAEIVNVNAAGFVEHATTEVTTQSTLRKSTLSLVGTAAQSNLYKAIDLLPSLHVETSDAYGLSSRQPWNLRIRGQAGIGTSTSVEGVPIWAIETPGPRVDMFDLENVDSMTLVRGGVPAAQGLGAQDTAGSLDIHLLRPADGVAVTATQSAGSWGFDRTFLRVDSGRLSSGTQLFGSFSLTTNDKWKGAGDGYRNHGGFGVEQRVSSNVSAGVYFDINQENQHAYRSLTYAQIQNLPANATIDYNTTLTGNPTTDASYFDFNQQKDRNTNLAGRVSIVMGDRSTLTIRPYYWTEYQPAQSAQTIPATTLTGVRLRTNFFDRSGVVATMKTRVGAADLTFGDWIESFNLPISEKYYTVGASGSLIFNRWALNEPDGRGWIHSPFVSADITLGSKTRVDAGLRYFHLANPGQIAYNTSSLGDMSYEDALASNPPVDTAASFTGTTQAPWLPFAGLSYQAASSVTAYANYGRNYARSQSYPELMQTFLSGRAAYTAAGVDMQYLYDQFDLATSNNYEAGVRFNRAGLYLVPSVFYADYRNKLLTVFDPVVGRTVRQAVGRSRTAGVELEFGATPVRQLAVFGSVSYNRSELRDDLYTAANAFIPVKGKQTPDTPHTLAKVGITYTAAGIAVSPVVRYIDSRFGDALNSQSVPSYKVADLTLSYALKSLPFLHDVRQISGLTLIFSTQNLLDHQYVAVIGAFEDAQSASYFIGAPRTYSVRLGVALGK